MIVIVTAEYVYGRAGTALLYIFYQGDPRDSGHIQISDEDIGRLVLNQQLRLNDADGCLAGQVPVAHDPVEL